jgi:hypothetical protein
MIYFKFSSCDFRFNELTINPNITKIINNEEENNKLLKILLILDEHKTKNFTFLRNKEKF